MRFHRSRGEFVGGSQRFRQTKSSCRFKRNPNGRFERKSVADAHVYGPVGRLRSKHDPYDFPVIFE